MIRVLFFTVLFTTFLYYPSVAQEADDLIRQMFARTRNISTMKYVMKKYERIDGKMVEQQSFVKLNRDPLKVYIKQIYPKEGVEVLFLEDNNDLALVNPNGFPWFNLRLNPMGSVMRKDQHHTLLNAGFDHVVNILDYLFIKYDNRISSMVHIIDEQQLAGRDCWVIKLENPHFKLEPYELKEGENIDSLAKRLMLSQHMVVEMNDNLSDVDDVHPGKKIMIPSDYSPEMILYIDKKLMIPVVMKVFDKKGLYEHYEYLNVELNPLITEEEFSETYAEYGF